MPTKSVHQGSATEPKMSRFFHALKKYSSILPSTCCVFLSFSWTFCFFDPTSCQTEIVLKKPGGKINFPLFLAHNGALIKIWKEIVEPLTSWHLLWNLCTFWHLFTLLAKPIKSHCDIPKRPSQRHSIRWRAKCPWIGFSMLTQCILSHLYSEYISITNIFSTTNSFQLHIFHHYFSSQLLFN